MIYKPLVYKQLHKIMWQYYFRVPLDDYKAIYKNQFGTTYQESDQGSVPDDQEEEK